MSRQEQTQGTEWRGELARLHERIAPRFGRPEVRKRAGRYLVGLFGPVERRNGWQMAEQIGEERADGVQRLLNAARWDADAVRDDLREYVVERLGDPSGVLTVVETGFPKKGQKSAGVARQRNPTTGRVEDCQVCLFLAYSSPRGWAFIDRALYLPEEEWAKNEERRREAGVPEQLTFATRSQLARRMLERAFAAEVPATWVSGGGAYGNDEQMRRWLESRGRSYVLAAMYSLRPPRATETVLPRIPEWVEVGAGGRVMRPYKWAYGPLRREPGTVHMHGLLGRYSNVRTEEYAYYRTYGPSETPLSQLAWIAGTPSTIKEGVERAKGEVGLDQYEVRCWDAWHRHVTFCLLADASLQIARARAMGHGDHPHPTRA